MAQLTIERPLVQWLEARDARLARAVFPGFAKPGHRGPYLTYRRVSSERWGHLKGAAGVSRARVELNVWSRDHAEARAIADKVVGTQADPGLDRFAGTMDGVTVQFAGLLDQGDDGDAGEDATEDVWHRVRSDFTIVWEEG